MKTITVMIHVAIVTALLLFSASESRAGGLIECNNCASPKDAALLSGSGLAVVMDFERARLSAFEVEYDREIRKWRALSTPVPAQIQMAFLRILDATSAFRAPPEEAHAMAGGGSVVVLHPDNPGNSNGVRFPESYKSSNTFDIVSSATLRTRLGQYGKPNLEQHCALDSTSGPELGRPQRWRIHNNNDHMA